jgi:hypothetical protein
MGLVGALVELVQGDKRPRTALRYDKVRLVDKAKMIGGDAERAQMRARVQVPHVNAVASGDRQSDLEVSARCVVRHGRGMRGGRSRKCV